MLVKTLTVEVQSKQYQVIGNDFYSMLEVVKGIPGRRWQQVVKDEETLLNMEIAQIQRLQAWMNWYAEVARYLSYCEYQHAKSYSFKSKSRFKAASLRDSGCLQHATKYVKKTVDEMTEPEILLLRRAINLVEECSAVELKRWLQYFQLNPLSMNDSQFEPHVVPLRFVDMSAVTVPSVSSALFPNVEIQNHIDPQGQIARVCVFQIGQPGDDS